ncbi:MAG: methyltransferase [Candidatus Accumulibacter sp.]|nr:methyltransferase [Accumulibacter sp.]
MTAFQTLSRKASYLREFMRTPREIGSILPSSRYLCREMLAAIDWKSAVSLVELGAAEGVLTARILKRMRPDASLTVYEIRPEFVRVLREIRDPRLTICDHSAEFLSGNHDAIISSLPLVTLPKRVALRVLNASMKAIAGRHGGLFVQYQYSSLAERFLSRFFVWRKTFVLRNVPPAHVYTCRLRPPAAPGSLRSFLG